MFELLRTFHWVARLGSFSKAAEHLGVSQPCVSQRMKRLEAGAGPLFDRGKLTPHGEALARDISQMIIKLEALEVMLCGTRSA